MKRKEFVGRQSYIQAFPPGALLQIQTKLQEEAAAEPRGARVGGARAGGAGALAWGALRDGSDGSGRVARGAAAGAIRHEADGDAPVGAQVAAVGVAASELAPGPGRQSLEGLSPSERRARIIRYVCGEFVWVRGSRSGPLCPPCEASRGAASPPFTPPTFSHTRTSRHTHLSPSPPHHPGVRSSPLPTRSRHVDLSRAWHAARCRGDEVCVPRAFLADKRSPTARQPRGDRRPPTPPATSPAVAACMASTVCVPGSVVV